MSPLLRQGLSPLLVSHACRGSPLSERGCCPPCVSAGDSSFSSSRHSFPWPWRASPKAGSDPRWSPEPSAHSSLLPRALLQDCDTPASGSPSSTSPDHRHSQFYPEKLHPPAWKLSPGNTLGTSQGSPPWFPTSLSVTSLLPDGKS